MTTATAQQLTRIVPQNKAGDLIEFDVVDQTAYYVSEVRAGSIHPYPVFVNNLFKEMGSPEASMMHAAAGFAGEGGEVLDIAKKSWVYGKQLDAENLLEELGDSLFYFQKMLNMMGWTIQDVQAANVAKLAKRYPLGTYTDAHAIARADKAITGETDAAEIAS
jgi:NTP pyrophosphatase (non-canonical NTP hydrolase)